jgi:photosystem II stability/assembly factor-like uncharacterized protein
VPGALWSDSPDRGLYRTTDGGKKWELALKGSNRSTGCSAVAIDPNDSNVMFAALWDFRRKGWTFRSGGDGPNAASGSGLFRSSDGGNTWNEITAENSKGFPKKPFGRIAVAIAPSNSKRVYAFVESTDSALFVSDDGGSTWDKRDKSQWMVWRPFYFASLVVDPKNPGRLFKTDGSMIVSEDAGKSFAAVGGFGGMHGDVHCVWIDPTNPQTVFSGDDGGMWYSYNSRTRITSMAGCRTTVAGWGTRSIPAASPIPAGKTCTMEMASLPFRIRVIPITFTLNTRVVMLAG